MKAHIEAGFIDYLLLEYEGLEAWAAGLLMFLLCVLFRKMQKP